MLRTDHFGFSSSMHASYLDGLAGGEDILGIPHVDKPAPFLALFRHKTLFDEFWSGRWRFTKGRRSIFDFGPTVREWE